MLLYKHKCGLCPTIPPDSLTNSDNYEEDSNIIDEHIRKTQFLKANVEIQEYLICEKHLQYVACDPHGTCPKCCELCYDHNLNGDIPNNPFLPYSKNCPASCNNQVTCKNHLENCENHCAECADDGYSTFGTSANSDSEDSSTLSTTSSKYLTKKFPWITDYLLESTCLLCKNEYDDAKEVMHHILTKHFPLIDDSEGLNVVTRQEDEWFSDCSVSVTLTL